MNMNGKIMKNGSSPRTVLVAGGAGFLGSHLCEALLRAGNEVICVDSLLTGSRDNIAGLRSSRFAFIAQDICEPLTLDRHVDEVYNLACAASPPRYQADPVHTMLTSVNGTVNLLRLAQAHEARFLQASTSEVYGDPDVHPQPESYRGSVSCTGPRACYDEGKRAAEALCFDFLRLGRVDVRVARIFNTYGPRMQPDDGRVISNLVSQALAGQPLTIFGDGSQTRSFCFVSDLIAGLIALMRVRENPGTSVNLGNPCEFSIAELATLVTQLVPHARGVEYRTLPVDDPRQRKPDISLAKAALGWVPCIQLKEGLAMTIDSFAEASRQRKKVTRQAAEGFADERELEA